MKNYLLLSLLCLLVACQNDSKNKDVSDYIPKNAFLVIKSKNIQSVLSNIRNNDFSSKISNQNTLVELEKKLSVTKYIKTDEEVIISIINNEVNGFSFSIATPYKDSLFLFDEIKNFSSETLKYENLEINKLNIEKEIIYSTIKDSIILVSDTEKLLKSLYESENLSNKLKRIVKSDTENSTLSTFINSGENNLNNFMILDSISFSQFTDDTLLDLDISQDQILLNGITKANDSTKGLLDVFKNTIPQENKLAYITPSSADGFLSLTFDSFKIFSENLSDFKNDTNSKLDTLLVEELLFDMSTEVGVIYSDTSRAFVLNSLDESITANALESRSQATDNYREIPIYSFDNPKVFAEVFYPFVTTQNFSNYCVIENNFIFSDDIEFLKKCISNFQNNTVYANKDDYKETSKNLSSSSSMLLVINDKKLNSIISPQVPLPIESYKCSAFQCTYDTYFAHLNIVIKKARSKMYTSGVSEAFNIKLDNELLNSPQFVTNHRTKEEDIVVQDVENNLYLISNKGEILWKKNIQGEILGKICQVDIYKNGRLQLAFTTSNRLYVLDRNGKDVTNFPLKFNDAITQPLSVFDYDNNRNYRLMVTQESNVLLYNLKAKIVSGFEFKSAGSKIITQPQHFRIGTKDYITIKTKEKLYILNRRGKVRVTPKQQVNYSSEPIFLYKSNFTTTDDNGNLISIDRAGNVSMQNVNLNDQHHIFTTSKTLVTLTDNKLTIKGRTVELDFGIYSKPEIFYINDKIYVSTTDLQSNRVYLFDSQAKPIPNFPVYGNSNIDMINADKDKAVEFITKNEKDGVILYQIN